MKAVATNVSFPKVEQEILKFWKENDIFMRSMDPSAPTKASEKTSDKRESYVFYDGPPFATGLPHYGHLLAGTIKDVVGRFFTMKGFHVDRRFGWDCHGVPVEFEIQKKLELHGVKAIREFGIDKFNEECRSIVLRYTEEWRTFVERSGRWANFDNQYRTMDLEFMESVWWVTKSLWDKGLIYEGVKCVPYSWAINTPLSNFEANLNYQDTQDPAVTVRAPLIDDLGKHLGLELPDLEANIYIWTTTPWTLPSNLGIAVNPEITYALVKNEDEIAIVAKDLATKIFPSLSENVETQDFVSPQDFASPGDKPSPEILAEIPGLKLVGLSYTPFFPYFEKERANKAFVVYPAEYVTAEDGTGLVHLASFGEEDLKVFLEHGLSVIDPVDEDGNFGPEVSDFEGMNVKAADSKIISALREKGLLVEHKTVVHSYPFCYRTNTPLINRSRTSWFVKVEEILSTMQEGNSKIHWVPSHLRDGRFGKWLEGAKDWAISRDRFWGTPIPIWRCESCDHEECIGSVSELKDKTGAEITDLHTHFIDDLEFSCEKCKSSMKRIPQVFDCWFESGSMPYAQSHYPFENKESFEANFPADFIAEGLDQTRGWFYTLLVLSSALFEKPAFKNVIVNGIVLAEDGKKMSKSLKNYPPPEEVMNSSGADAMRLYLLASAATRAEELRFSKEGVKQVVRQTILPLWNSYNFLVTYATVDQWTPADIPSEASKNLLDRWIISKTASLIKGVDQAISSYHLYLALPPILEFVDQLTNWYIRLNRRRFWAGETEAEKNDKKHAYATLHATLVSFVRVLAPLAPFISEEIFQNLKTGVSSLDFDSVHLAPFPKLEEIKGAQIDEELEEAMELFEEVILLGRSLRNDTGLKVRQPLSKITIVHQDKSVLEKVKLLEEYICDELNVKAVEYSEKEAEYVELSAKLNLKKLGKTLGPTLGSAGMKGLRQLVEALPTDEIKKLEAGESLNYEGLELKDDDFLVERKAKEDAGACASSGNITVLLDTFISQELELEGYARELINRVQKLRKDSGFEVSDRIVLRYLTASEKLALAFTENKTKIMEEVLAIEMERANDSSIISEIGEASPQEIGGEKLVISVARTQA